MKVISFNANGIRSATNKGFFEWLHAQEPDFLCIQEIKADAAQLIPDLLYYPDDYFCVYYSAQKKGYSGVAILAKKKPLHVAKGFGVDWCDVEGRYIRFDYETLSIASIYFPSGTSGEERQQLKYEFLDHFEKHLDELKQTHRHLILCGDYNIAHRAIDLKNWKSNQKNSGFLPQERDWMDKLYGEWGMVDAFRVLNQEPDQYTWWSHRGRAYEKNVGWRIDYQVITPELALSVRHVHIESKHRFSDHAPLIVEYDNV